MLDRHGRITLYVIVSSFSVYFLPTGLIGYTGVLLAITVVGVQLLLDEKFSFRMSHFPLLIYITWIIVSLIIGHQNSYSVPTLAFSFGPVALTILSIPLGRWLAESDQVLLRICWVVAILGVQCVQHAAKKEAINDDWLHGHLTDYADTIIGIDYYECKKLE